MSLSIMYAVIPNEVFEDKRLDYRTRGLLCTIMTRTEDWKFSVSSLAELVIPRDNNGNVIERLKGVGKGAIRTSILKLEELGYLKRIPQQDEKGLFSGYEYKLLLPPPSSTL